MKIIPQIHINFSKRNINAIFKREPDLKLKIVSINPL